MSDEDYTPHGPGRSLNRKPLSTHVPIRFTPDVIAQVKRLAEKDRKTVSSWIRDAVEDEIERRRSRRQVSYSVGQPGLNTVTNLL